MNNLTNISKSDSNGDFVLSSITRFEQNKYDSRASVKMVLTGTEGYRINQTRFDLNTKGFLVVGANSKVGLRVNSPEAVKGICIFPSNNLINQVARPHLEGTKAIMSDPYRNANFELTNNLMRFDKSRTGRYLKRSLPTILHKHRQNVAIDFESFYVDFAENIVLDQLKINTQLSRIPSKNNSTKEELHRRVARTRDYLEDNYIECINVEALAEMASLSKYYYIRTFKYMYGLSPYQFLLRIRLAKAKALLSKDYSYEETSQLIGFSDGKNLRKAIKRNQKIKI